MKHIAIVLLGLCSVLASAQRLPDVALPDHYTIRFDPDLKTAKFTGEETIDIRVLKPTSTITLNSVELEVTGYATQGNTTQTATITPQGEDEMIVLTFAKPLDAGPAKLHLKFSGDMANKLRGLYLSKTSCVTMRPRSLSRPTRAARSPPSTNLR